MGDQGDPDNTSVKNCPVDYCRSEVSSVSASIGLGGVACELPQGSSLDKCYQLSDKCSNVFQNTCNNTTLWDSDVEDTPDTIKMKVHCRNWAKVQPALFENFAGVICKFPTPDGTKSLSDTLKDNQRKRDHVVNLYNSELCSGWLTESSESKELLMEVCSAAVDKQEDGSYILTDFDEDMGQLCKCHYPIGSGAP